MHHEKNKKCKVNEIKFVEVFYITVNLCER